MKPFLIFILLSLCLLSSRKKLGGFFTNDDPSEMFDGRILYDTDGSLLLVDSNGDQYEPYSMAWRYLGMYLDCGNNDDDHGVCYRKILWAAYIDPRYQGGSIGEYQYYNISTEAWDKSTCRTRRCARMDCHESNTNFKLLGVFKENDGLYDFAEQLFKHQGYCVWDSDTYDFMSSYRENWPTGCTDIYFYDYNNGGYQTVYWDMQPYAFGNFTYGLYEDESCSTLSQYNVSDLLRVYYNQYGYSDEKTENQISAFEYRQERVNEYMNDYKICQPCRAYSKYENYGDDDGGGDDSNDSGDHSDEGEGSTEQWGYNCYDDAGYRNCNQTKTDMESIDTEDLEFASEQGTILEIKVNGKVYGSGGYQSEPESQFNSSDIFTLTFALLSVCIIAFAWKKKSSINRYCSFKRKIMPKSLQEDFMTLSCNTSTVNTISSDSDINSTIIKSVELGTFKSPKSKKKKKRDKNRLDNWVVLRARSKRDCHDILYNADYVKQVSKHRTEENIVETSESKEIIEVERCKSLSSFNGNEEENPNFNVEESTTHLPPGQSNNIC